MPDLGALSSTYGASGSSLSAAPHMIGDFFGSTVIIQAQVEGPDEITVVPNGGSARILKISHHNSPLPRCRVFFDYSHFHNALQGVNGDGDWQDFNVDRYVFGWEQCFLDSLMSVELRVPFSDTLSSDQTQFTASQQDVEFGNMNLAIKALLLQRTSTALSAGLGINLPTANDFQLLSVSTGLPTLTVEDDSVHLAPFVGFLWTPTDRIFSQSFLQFDFDASGNDISEDGLTMGTYNDQSLMFVDTSLGYWLYRNPCALRNRFGRALRAALHDHDSGYGPRGHRSGQGNSQSLQPRGHPEPDGRHPP